MNTPNEYPDDHTFAGLIDRLDALGEQDASEAPQGIEDRVLASVGRVFVPAPIAITTARSAWWQRGPVRVAAGVVILSGVGLAAYLQSSGGGTIPGAQPNGAEMVSVAMVEQRIEGLLALASESGDDFGNQVASIELWTEALDAELGDTWGGSDLFDGDNTGFGSGAL